jgi:hypothetical protein
MKSGVYPVLLLNIYVTTSFNQHLRDGGMPFFGRDEERCGPIRILVVDQGLRACHREQRPSSRCIAITRCKSEFPEATHSSCSLFIPRREEKKEKQGSLVTSDEEEAWRL